MRPLDKNFGMFPTIRAAMIAIHPTKETLTFPLQGYVLLKVSISGILKPADEPPQKVIWDWSKKPPTIFQ